MQRLLELARRFVSTHTVLVTLVILGFAHHAAAADDSKRHAAFRQGVAAIEAEKWDEALAVYRKLWDEERTYDVALSLGQVELNLKAYRDAAEHLDFGLRNIPPREDAEMATRARRMLDLARNEVGAVEIRVDRPNAEVFVDGKALARPIPPEIFLDAGPHAIEAKSEGSTPIQQAIHLTAGQKRTLTLAFGDRSGSAATAGTAAATSASKPAPATPPASPKGSGAETNKDDSSLRSAILIGGLAVTAVATAVTVTFALQGASASSDADDARAQATARFGLDPCSSEAGAASSECHDIAEALDRRASNNRVANVSLFVAITAAVGTATTFFLWPVRSERPERALRLTPHVGRNAGGALLTGSF